MVTECIKEDESNFYNVQNELSRYKIFYLNRFILKEIIMCLILTLFINDKFRNKIIAFVEQNKIFEENRFFIRSLDLNCITLISFCVFLIDYIHLLNKYGIPDSFIDQAFYVKYLISPLLYIISYKIFNKFGRLALYILIGFLLLFLQPKILIPLVLNMNRLLKGYEKFDINLFDDRIKRKLIEFNIEDNVYISKIPDSVKNMGVFKYFTRILVLIDGSKIEYENNPKLLNSMFSHELGHVSRGYKDMIFISFCEWLLDILIIFLIDFFSFRSRKSSKLSRFTNFFIFCLVYFLILRDYIFVFSLILKRNEEVYADKYAVSLGYGEELAYSLFKITYKFSCLQESSIYNFIKFVHPSTITRIKRICR
ncbi:hypothetical protein CWI39_0182p0020 [Hamiltosporidium magnivora]|uniref:Peptidase M48 domain-containing protein n=1 Tax=Hamiltosporidium magnivora TaxID=148818 RepID=A0A4Q9LJR1_9MICR|nr:hypothetical protein CWI39_0182p0020 [Hamiltosporidium magnivora]